MTKIWHLTNRTIIHSVPEKEVQKIKTKQINSLVLNVRYGRAIPLLTLWAFVVCYRENFKKYPSSSKILKNADGI
jgi:hypothetical protein